MTILRFVIPPVPFYMASGFVDAAPGFKHTNRRNIGVFDLLTVSEGCLHITEENRSFDVGPGQTLILRPDSHHFATRASAERTCYYWMHFQTSGEWTTEENAPQRLRHAIGEYGHGLDAGAFTLQTFIKQIPQAMTLAQPAKLFVAIEQLSEMDRNNHQSEVGWRQQQLFQQVLEQLSAESDAQRTSPAALCAERAATYLREHYKESVTLQALGESINFHPVYIARCMRKQFGCSPIDYLNRFRIDQAKLLLLQTDHPISFIAEAVGFNHAAYFAACFVRLEGISAREYRKRITQG
ncbi:helix-turn-helix domain-containing protein [Paenibacillus sp. NPDC058071]|uniref:helix-turn-helix domain-containing protein n=1 Tax=Paenibacillus sp. NPDC058071 TaxID=3346326 RepID=UPI0036DA11D7